MKKLLLVPPIFLRTSASKAERERLRGTLTGIALSLRATLPLLLAAWCAVVPLAGAEDARTPTITAISPSSNEVPANHLKFYIHFSQPMRQGIFLQHCSLRDERGAEVPEPFRETELWSDDRTRLTLWLHPGRQKTGVNLNVEFGPVLHAGRGYTLVVSRKWASENSVSLGADFRKAFRAIAPVHSQLDANMWRITPPPAGSNVPLAVRFPAPLDHALSLRCIRVFAADGKILAGRITLTDHDQSWSFIPAHPWIAEAHTLAADSILEDLAGNSLARPFELDLTKAAPAKRAAAVTIPFRPTNEPK